MVQTKSFSKIFIEREELRFRFSKIDFHHFLSCFCLLTSKEKKRFNLKIYRINIKGKRNEVDEHKIKSFSSPSPFFQIKIITYCVKKKKKLTSAFAMFA